MLKWTVNLNRIAVLDPTEWNMRRSSRLTWIAILLILALTGCSIFHTPPRLARVQIIGPGNHAKEFIFSLENLESEDAGIQLTDRYTLQVDLQWLWYNYEDLTYGKGPFETEVQNNLTPWFICKYRF